MLPLYMNVILICLISLFAVVVMVTLTAGETADLDCLALQRQVIKSKRIIQSF